MPIITLHTLGTVDLRGPGEVPLRAVLAQPKRFALLAYVAVAGAGGPQRRDVLLGLFWPDQDTERGRAALRQALRFLRREMGEDIVVNIGDDALSISDSLLRCDALEFRHACEDKRFEDALRVYSGDFLDGFFVPNAAPEFDDWLEAERQGQRMQALDAARNLIAQARADGDLSLAVQWARRATAIAPDDEGAQRVLLTLLDESGDRAGALRAYDDFAAALMRQLGVAPSKETEALVAAMRSNGARTPTGPRAVSLDARKRIAVLTFVNMTADAEQDFLCNGLTEELLAVLSRLGQLRVVPVGRNFGLEGRAPDLKRFREQLDVDAVLDGTIWRGGAIGRINAHLVDAATGTQLWADSYEREWQHVSALQGSLARSIAGAIHLALTGESATLPQRPTADVEAYNLYLKGRFHWANRVAAPLRALEYLNQAVAADPNFALAHAAIADVYNTAASWETSTLPPWEAVPKAQAAAIRALEIDPHLAEAHAALGYISAHFLHDLDAAEHQLCRALSINPDYQHAHHWYSHLAMAEGRVDESLQWSLRALQSDPLDPIISIHLAWHYWCARRYEDVLEQCARTSEFDASGILNPMFSGLAHIQRGDAAAAIDAHRDAVARSSGSGICVCALGYSYAAGGERKLARQVLKRLREIGVARGMFGYEMAIIHGALGETDRAFAELDRAYRERSSWMIYLNVDPRLDRLRGDPRFASMLDKIGLLRFVRDPPRHS